MQLVSAHINPLGNFLLGLDKKLKYHGVFCWSAEQIAAFTREWRLNSKEERILADALIEQEINIKTNRDPDVVHGIGAALIGKQFATVQQVRELVNPRTTVTLEQGRVYFRTKPLEARAHEATLLFYVTPEGAATLAHMRTKDQAAKLLRENWINEDGREVIKNAIRTLPTQDDACLHPTYIQGLLIQQIITAQLLYRSLFPEEVTARN